MTNNVLIIGTTPTHTFKLPFDRSLINDLEVVYLQDQRTVIRKSLKDCRGEGSSITVRLTQEETFRFRQGYACAVIRVKDSAGNVTISRSIVMYVEDPQLRGGF